MSKVKEEVSKIKFFNKTPGVEEMICTTANTAPGCGFDRQAVFRIWNGLLATPGNGKKADSPEFANLTIGYLRSVLHHGAPQVDALMSFSPDPFQQTSYKTQAEEATE